LLVVIFRSLFVFLYIFGTNGDAGCRYSPLPGLTTGYCRLCLASCGWYCRVCIKPYGLHGGYWECA